MGTTSFRVDVATFEKTRSGTGYSKNGFDIGCTGYFHYEIVAERHGNNFLDLEMM
jgi:hypothetical protein